MGTLNPNKSLAHWRNA